MPAEATVNAMGEMLTWLERELKDSRDHQQRLEVEVAGLRRQLAEVIDQQALAEKAIRDFEPRLLPFKGLPEKIRNMDQAAEQVLQQVTTGRSEVDNALRILRAESEYSREERAGALTRIDSLTAQLGLVLADIGQLQAQTGQASQAASSIHERQREVEARTEQMGLRLERSIEVHRDLETRIKSVVVEEMEDRFEVVFDRLQVVGEMVQRNERLVESVTAERSLRQEVLDQVAVWREEHNRLELRVAAIEELGERVIGDVDKLRGDIALLEGRHSGLGERVGTIRRDIAEVVDHVRAEFAKYNQLMEKQRRKQIQVLEQELREMKFHAFRPPEEP